MELRIDLALGSCMLALLLAVPAPMSRAQQLAMSTAAELPAAPAPAPENASAEPAAIMPVSLPRPLPPRARPLAVYDWSLLAAAATLRYLDYKTTEKCASDPKDFEEKELPESLVRNKPAFAAFEAGTVAANYFAYRLVARRHRNLARLGQYINIGSIAWAVGGNYAAIAQHFPRNLNISPQHDRH